MKRRYNVTKPVIIRTASAKESECRICIINGLSFLNLSPSVLRVYRKEGLNKPIYLKGSYFQLS